MIIQWLYVYGLGKPRDNQKGQGHHVKNFNFSSLLNFRQKQQIEDFVNKNNLAERPIRSNTTFTFLSFWLHHQTCHKAYEKTLLTYKSPNQQSAGSRFGTGEVKEGEWLACSSSSRRDVNRWSNQETAISKLVQSSGGTWISHTCTHRVEKALPQT